MKKMWAWYDVKKDEYAHLYTKEAAAQICNSDSFKAAQKSGKAEMHEVVIKQICPTCGSDSGHYFYCPHRFKTSGG